jgi:hypothetical protein
MDEDELDVKVIGLMADADNERKPVEINVQWFPYGHEAPDSFRV